MGLAFLEGISQGGEGMKKAKRMPPTEELHPFDIHYITNPSQEELRKLAVEHSLACWETKYGGVNKISRNKARYAKYTYLVAPDEDAHLYSTPSPSSGSIRCRVPTWPACKGR